MVRLVLFDLDDTLFDHKHSRLCGLAALQTLLPKLQAVSLAELEREYEKLLSVDYHAVLDRKISMQEGTVQRIKRLCLGYLPNISQEQAQAAGELYNHVYLKNRRAVPRAHKFLEACKQFAKVGVVTNGLVAAQKEKLALCRLEPLVDFMVTSEETGIKKPAPGIFQEALKRADVAASEAGLVGDSWESDILPAYRLGIKPVWLNRYGLSCPDFVLAEEIHSYPCWSPIALFGRP
jgi:putative hydrolase of the HAD superfamily